MNKRIILDKETWLGNEKNTYNLEEYLPFKSGNGIVCDDKLGNTKKIKIIIDTFNIDEATEFLQECKKEIKKEEK